VAFVDDHDFSRLLLREVKSDGRADHTGAENHKVRWGADFMTEIHVDETLSDLLSGAPEKQPGWLAARFQ
jgi:hypothetical protein